MSGLPFLTMLIASGLLALLSGELRIRLKRAEQKIVRLDSTLEVWRRLDDDRHTRSQDLW